MLQGADQNLVRELRIRAGLTQEELAVRLSVSTSTVRNWERGKIEPSMTRRQWITFCEAVGISFEKLPVDLAVSA